MTDSTLPANCVLTIDALVRAVGVNSAASHALFLGAGASITSGVPAAGQCIWQWKLKIFLTKNPGLETHFSDVSLMSTQKALQKWLDTERIYPAANSEEEYSFFAESCYPISDDRRRFFQGLIATAKPYLGYQLLCLLAETGTLKQVWTVNFDSLVPRAVATTQANVVPVEIGLDSTGRMNRQQQTGELYCIALHGDYRYDQLKNTSDELREQDESLRAMLNRSLRDNNLIVVGYSGRDKSVMDVLTDAYGQGGTGRLYWCGHGDSEPLESIRKLIHHARNNGREAFYIATSGFDDLMARLSSHCLTGTLLGRASELRREAGEPEQVRAFTLERYPAQTLIKSNAFPIDCPSEIFQFHSNSYHRQGAWKALRKDIAGKEMVAGLVGGKVLALGTIDDIKDGFGNKIDGPIERTFIASDELSFANGVVTSLLTESVTRAIASAVNLEHDGKNLLWDKKDGSVERVNGSSYRAYKAATIRLRKYGGQTYLVVKPTVKGETLDGKEIPHATVKELKRLLLTKQWNKEFNIALNHWRKRMFPTEGQVFEFPHGRGSSFRFKIKRQPIFAGICDSEPDRRGANLTNGGASETERLHYHGIQYREPSLLFSNREATAFVKDAQPIRGIYNNRPYDFSFSKSPLASELRLGIVCPNSDSSQVHTYLQGLRNQREATTKKEYLLGYPGFEQAFGIPIVIPQSTDTHWANCAEPGGSSDADTARSLGQNIIQAIDKLQTVNRPNVVIIYVPERWRNWNEYKGEHERFDLHDFVKAHCVQRGITTQFLRQATLQKTNQCEVRQWLALSIYAKSMRTPWVLDVEDDDTAFVGIGFNIDTVADESHVLVGCSHIYNSSGLGLGYRLSKIENPIIKQGNPFMSLDDARRLGENTRQLFFASKGRLPRRVVIHKRTPFLKEERSGLLEGLKGVEEIEMLELTIEPALRFVVGNPRNTDADNYPIRRGTTVLLDERRLLLWVHGAAEGVVRGKTYYQGKSRIPAPLMVTRHYGVAPTSKVVQEILGLSKMNWNTFDMYTKLPATIESSGEIARIGSLLQRFGDISYDYRLFI